MSETALEPIKIRGSFTPDPNVCLFEINRPILPDYSVVFSTVEEGLGSPLIDAVFSVDCVTKVKIHSSTLTVSKEGDEAWPKVAQVLIPKLKEAFNQETPAISMGVMQALKDMPVGGGMEETITGLLDEYINPSLASHGGWVKLVKIEDRDVYLEMGGGCQGCASSRATMKNGVEGMIRNALPNVREIIDITDHDAGENPYYTS